VIAMQRFDEEILRTAFQRKVVSRLPAEEVLRLATDFFGERGYRTGRTGRPGQVFVMGKAEGVLPRVTGEVEARADVGKPGTTLVTLNAAGERLGPAMAEFARELRPRRGSANAESAGGEDSTKAEESTGGTTEDH
jgi:hypothetical protein